MVTVRVEAGYSPAALRRVRKARKLTQKTVASAIGVSQPYLSQIELGQRGADPLLLLRLASALGCSVADFMPRKRKRTEAGGKT